MNTYTDHLKANIDAGSRVNGAGSHLRGWLQSLGATLRRNHERRVTIRELRALSDRQLEDIGMARAQIPEIVHALSARKAAATRVTDKKEGRASFGAGYCIGHG